MDIREGFLYTKEHEWVKIDGVNAVFGITDYAQHSLGDITFVELPKPGEELEQFKQYAVVESVKAASDIFAPLSGAVVKVNESLADKPELINESAFDKGWMVAVKLKEPIRKEKLMDHKAYGEYLKTVSK